MAGRRLLLMHVTTSSGHHHASQAVCQALRRLDPDCQVVSVDAFDYTSRVVRLAIMRSYLSLIRYQPNVWEYLYDNPVVHRHAQHFRSLLHRYHTTKLTQLLETVQPHAIACTQAFPCGMMADLKKRQAWRIPLIGILTDYAPHLYWLHDHIDGYAVPSDEVKERFVSYGIDPSRITVSGIPIEPRFLDSVDRAHVYAQFQLDPGVPVILIMGGGGGFGPLQDLVVELDRLPMPGQFLVLTGTNQAMLNWFGQQPFHHRVRAIGYTDAVPELMEMATLIITKPGGLTTAEALAKGLPMLIITPIPGQEQCNARYLLAQDAAIALDGPQTAAHTVAQLLGNPQRLAALRRNAKHVGHPAASLDIAKWLLQLADQTTVWN